MPLAGVGRVPPFDVDPIAEHGEASGQLPASFSSRPHAKSYYDIPFAPDSSREGEDVVISIAGAPQSNLSFRIQICQNYLQMRGPKRPNLKLLSLLLIMRRRIATAGHEP